MTIIRDGRNATTAKDFVIVGVGGAGAITASELSKVLGNPDDVIAVDREMEDMRSVNVGRRISIGYPMFTRETEGIEDDEHVDKNDLFPTEDFNRQSTDRVRFGRPGRHDYRGDSAGSAPNSYVNWGDSPCDFDDPVRV